MHPDRLGSVRAITTNTGTLTTTRTYTPYGTPTSTDTTSNFGYAGEYADTNTNLIYLRARYYQPTSGQFITEDPAVAQTKQPYLYTGGDPVNHTDPSGLKSIWGHIVSGVRKAFYYYSVGQTGSLHGSGWLDKSTDTEAQIWTGVLIGTVVAAGIACIAFCGPAGAATATVAAAASAAEPELEQALETSAPTIEAATCEVAQLANPSVVNNAGGTIRSFVTEADTTYYRVVSGDRTIGGFLTGTPPSNPSDAVRGLALPPGNTAEFVQEVLVPAGTRLQSSTAAPAFGQPGGMLQYELLDRIPSANFGPGKPLR